ncbi:hypothetical protein PR048_016224 [Dryococelus australis]|uniref:Uncharacterized protein n=1 Tax=Dryococelus australis TaxID=614101 RepID=A0ABQ9HJ45_9NEOP|nr:hypothetical protein PR048_016224 [Dryococelus australis]
MLCLKNFSDVMGMCYILHTVYNNIACVWLLAGYVPYDSPGFSTKFVPYTAMDFKNVLGGREAYEILLQHGKTEIFTQYRS